MGGSRSAIAYGNVSYPKWGRRPKRLLPPSSHHNIHLGAGRACDGSPCNTEDLPPTSQSHESPPCHFQTHEKYGSSSESWLVPSSHSIAPVLLIQRRSGPRLGDSHRLRDRLRPRQMQIYIQVYILALRSLARHSFSLGLCPRLCNGELKESRQRAHGRQFPQSLTHRKLSISSRCHWSSHSPVSTWSQNWESSPEKPKPASLPPLALPPLPPTRPLFFPAPLSSFQLRPGVLLPP